MINTLYHRNQPPYTYVRPNHEIGLVVKAGQNLVTSIVVYFCDPMADWTPHGYQYQTATLTKVATGTTADYWEGKMASNMKRFRYAFLITPRRGKPFFYGECGRLPSQSLIGTMGYGFTYAYWSAGDLLAVPDWYRTTSWYQIFPDRFAKTSPQAADEQPWTKVPTGHEFYGGNLGGIIAKLPHIKALGFSGIYLTPIFKAQTAHRYETNDYYQIDPRLGTTRDFKKLIKAAHQLGMKVMLDAVFNHIGSHAKQFQDVLKKGQRSRYRDWFWINDFERLQPWTDAQPEQFKKWYPYETFAIVPSMPRLRWDNQAVANHLIKAAAKWTKMGIDGWRLDVSFEPPLSLWRQLHARLKQINPEIVIIGEVWWDAINWLSPDVWHGVMNYPVRDIIINYANSGQTNRACHEFVARFNDLTFTYNPEQLWGMFNLMASHDVPRLMTVLKNDETKYKFAMELCFLLPGSPSTYYGQEIGMTGANDPDNRAPYPWAQNYQTYFDFFKKLNAMRHQYLRHTDIFTRLVATTDGTTIKLSSGHKTIVIKGLEVTWKEHHGS